MDVCFEVKNSQDMLFCSPKQRIGSDRLVLLIFFFTSLEGTHDLGRDKIEPYSYTSAQAV